MNDEIKYLKLKNYQIIISNWEIINNEKKIDL